MLNLNNKIIFSWDVFNWSRSLNIWKKHSNIEKGNLNCLEIGAGPGGISLWVASYDNNILCTEYDNNMQIARDLHKVFNAQNIEYSNLDVLNIPFENHFDIIILKSVLGGLGNNNNIDLAIQQIHKSLKPEGYFLFAENLKGSMLLMWLRRRFSGCGTWWNYMDYKQFKQGISIFNEVNMKRMGVFGVLGRNEFQKAVIGASDMYLLELILPKNTFYIVAGVARK